MAGRRRMTAKEACSYACWIARTISCGNGSWARNGPKTRSCRPLSTGSSSCRIDWRPSRLLCASLAALGLLAALSVALSDLPIAGKSALSALALVYGLWLARREWRRPACALEIDVAGQLLMHRGAVA